MQPSPDARATGDSDDRLFERYRTVGEVGAIGELFDRVAPELLRLALHLSGRLDEAEDLVQETFLTALTERRRYRAQGRLRAWLAAILENRAKRLYRQRQRDGRARALDGVEELPVDAPTAAEITARRDDIEALAARIAALGEPYATVVGLNLRDGMGATEIARTLDRSADTVQSQLRRGLERLKQALPSGFALGAAITPRLDLQRAVVLGQAKALAPVVVTASGVAVGTTVSMRVAQLAALALFALGSAAFGWMQWGADTGSMPARAEARAASVAIDGTADESPSDATAGPPARAVVAGRSRLAASELPPHPYGLDWGPPVRLQVVDAESGEGVPGATVRLPKPGMEPRQHLSERAWLASLQLRAQDLEAYYASDPQLFGESLVTDSNGFVELPAMLVTNTWITARKDDRYGERHDDQARTIALASDRDFVVEVRDLRGAPVAGLPLLLHGVTRPLRYDLDDSRRAVTGKDGRAVFRHAGPLLETCANRGIETCRIHPNAALADEWQIELPTSRLLDPDTLTMTVPETGALRLHFRDTRGEPFPVREGWTSLRIAGRTQQLSLDPLDSVCEVPFLDPSAPPPQLDADAYGDGWIELPRPLAGQVRDVDVVLGRHATLFRGRLVDDAGAPLREAMFHLIEVGGDPALSEFWTDEHGNFATPIGEDGYAGHSALQVEHYVRYPGGIVDLHWPGPLRAHVDLTANSTGRVVELGDVVARQQPVVATGRLQILVPAELEDALRRHLVRRQPMIFVDVRRTDEFGRTDWTRADAASVELREDGSFTIRHEMSGAHDYRLRIDSRFVGGAIQTLSPVPVVCAPGSQDLQIDVPLGAAVSLQLPPTLLDAGPVALRLEPAPGVWPEHETRDPGTVGTGTWDHRLADPPRVECFGRGFWPGRYRILLVRGEDTPPLATWNDVELRAGETTVLDYSSAARR